ncbi:hypothetical protein MnTg02_01205 [bacterium MnTg02]|nr:hypothetical protein MnTg02_01205 [bacterium MnTg02]
MGLAFIRDLDVAKGAPGADSRTERYTRGDDDE